MYAALPLAFALLLGADPDAKAPRERSPIAASLPLLTEEEERKHDDVIDRFLKQDIGLLKGDDAKKAVRDFAALKEDAIPALIRGVNRAAKIEHSCPVVFIAKKLDRLLMASDDRELLEYAHDEIGTDVGSSRHRGVLQDLRFRITLRMNQLARRAPAPPAPKGPRLRTVGELLEAASTERGPRLKAVLLELEKRDGPEVLTGLGLAAGNYDSEVARTGRDALDRHLTRKGESAVRSATKNEIAEVRKAAARVAVKMAIVGPDLVPLLSDEKADVRETAHAALVKIAKGQDFGPTSSDASPAEREEARRRWQAWFDRARSP